jgi:hypothetical protein
METTTKATFVVNRQMWRAFRMKCFDAKITASAKLREFVKEEVEKT